MLIRSVIYVGLGIVLVVLAAILNTRLGWHNDLAWILVVGAAFAWPSEIAPIAGLLFGMILDSLTGTVGFYTIAYGGFGAVIMLLRRVFFLESFIAGWIAAIAGAELLWLFMGVLARAVNMLGGAAEVPGYVSPYIMSALIGFPFVWFAARRILLKLEEKGLGYNYGTVFRIIDRT